MHNRNSSFQHTAYETGEWRKLPATTLLECCATHVSELLLHKLFKVMETFSEIISPHKIIKKLFWGGSWDSSQINRKPRDLFSLFLLIIVIFRVCKYYIYIILDIPNMKWLFSAADKLLKKCELKIYFKCLSKNFISFKKICFKSQSKWVIF